MKNEELRTDRFRDFESDMLPEEEAAPRQERARRRREAEKRVYTVAGIFLGLILIIASATMLFIRGKNDASAGEAVVSHEDTLTEVVDPPMVLAATVDAVNGAQEDAVLEDTITQILSDMTIEDKVASLFLISPEQLTGVEVVTGFGDATKNALAGCAVGGIVYADKNLKTADQVKEMLKGTTDNAKYPLFLAVNENGEKRSAVAAALGEEVLASGEALIDAAAGTTYGEAVGAYLSLNGFNMNLSPVVNPLTGDAALAGFAYSEDPAQCAEVAGAVITGMQSKNTLTCAKYFPVYGERSDKSKEAMYGNELEPFRAAIEAGTSAIMMSNVALPAITGTDEPASLSSAVVSDLLRLEMGFEGIIVTDALNAEAIISRYDAKESVVRAISAGADMLYMPLDFQASYEALITAVEEGEISEERLDESLRRIFRVKYR